MNTPNLIAIAGDAKHVIEDTRRNRNRVAYAMNLLTSREAMILVMRSGGLSIKECGQALGLTPEPTRMLLARAKRNLFQILPHANQPKTAKV